MNRFGVVTFYNENDNTYLHKGMLTTIINKFKNLFAGQRIAIYRIGNNSTKQNRAGWAINIPSITREPHKKRERSLKNYKKQLFEWCEENSVEELYLGKRAAEYFFIGGKTRIIDGGKLVFASLIKEVLERVCERKGLELNNVDVCVINFSNDSIILPLLKFVAHDIKFITVICENTPSFISELDEIFAEKGNAIRVASDMKSALIDCKIVINLDNLEAFRERGLFSADMTLINLSSKAIKEYNYIKSEVVNSIEVDIPEEIRHNNQWMDSICHEFNSLELAEIFLRANIFTEGTDLISCCSEFVKSGMRVKNLIGRQGVI